MSFKNKSEIKTFSSMKELKEFISSRHALQEVLKEVLHTEGKL